MDNKTIIKVSNLTKEYIVYDRPIDRLKEALLLTSKSKHKVFKALGNISLEIQQGETVGIIGANGSGKSTLLKILTGVLTPTSGEVFTKGKIAALLELGAGFNPELSGIENIYLNGAIMGFSREEMDKKLKSIIDFADIGDFINQPVKVYSSGMFARLAFSVSINVDPDILIVDEALSVGDTAFQMKCYRKFNEFREKGKTILFVTHSIDTILRYCTSSVVLDKGKKIGEGSPKDMVDLYKKIIVKQYNQGLEDDFNREISVQLKEKNTEWKNNYIINKDNIEYGTKAAEIIDFGLFDKNGKYISKIDSNDETELRMRIKFNQNIQDPIFAFTIKDIKGNEICGTNSMIEHINTNLCIAGEEYVISFRQKFLLRTEKYALSLGCTGFVGDELVVFHRLYDVLIIEAVNTRDIVGLYDINSEVNLNKVI